MAAGATEREDGGGMVDLSALMKEHGMASYRLTRDQGAADAISAYVGFRNMPALVGVLCAHFSAMEVDELIARLLALRGRADGVAGDDEQTVAEVSSTREEEALMFALEEREEQAARVLWGLTRTELSMLARALLRLLEIARQIEEQRAKEADHAEQQEWRTRACSVKGCTERAAHQMTSGRAPHRCLFYLCAEHYRAGPVEVRLSREVE